MSNISIQDLLPILISIVAIIFSYYSFRVVQRRGLQPIIIFSNEGKDENGASHWYAENVGNAPAINVLLLGGVDLNNWDKKKILLLPALSKGSKHKLNWIDESRALAAVYTDIADRPYTTTTYDNKNRIYEKNILPNISATKFLWEMNKHDVAG